MHLRGSMLRRGRTSASLADWPFWLTCRVLRQEFLDVANDFRDALFLFQNTCGELFGRQMGDVFLGARVLAVEIAAVRHQFGGGHFPRTLVLFAFICLAGLAPPRLTVGKFLELDGRGFGVVLSAFGQRLFVIPDFARRPGAVEEQHVRRDAGVGREHAIGQPDDGVQVELLEQFLLDAAQTPSPNNVPFGTTTAARPGLSARDAASA